VYRAIRLYLPKEALPDEQPQTSQYEILYIIFSEYYKHHALYLPIWGAV